MCSAELVVNSIHAMVTIVHRAAAVRKSHPSCTTAAVNHDGTKLAVCRSSRPHQLAQQLLSATLLYQQTATQNIIQDHRLSLAR